MASVHRCRHRIDQIEQPLSWSVVRHNAVTALDASTMFRLVKPDVLKADAAHLETDRSAPLTCSVHQHRGSTMACHAASCPPRTTESTAPPAATGRPRCPAHFDRRLRAFQTGENAFVPQLILHEVNQPDPGLHPIPPRAAASPASSGF